MSGFDNSGNYGEGGYPPSGMPPEYGTPPGVPQPRPGGGPTFPGSQPPKRSGCASCLVGCLVVCFVLVLIVVGVSWYAVSWTRNNVLAREPIEIEAIDISDAEIKSLQSRLDEIKGQESEVFELTLTSEEMEYLLLASQKKQPVMDMDEVESEDYPDAEELNEMDMKLDIRFPEEDKVEFKLSTPFTGREWYLNVEGLLIFKIEDGETLVNFEKLKLGKVNLDPEQADYGNQILSEELKSDPQAAQMMEMIPYLKIEPGFVKIKLKVPAGQNDFSGQKGY